MIVLSKDVFCGGGAKWKFLLIHLGLGLHQPAAAQILSRQDHITGESGQMFQLLMQSSLVHFGKQVQFAKCVTLKSVLNIRLNTESALNGF